MKQKSWRNKLKNILYWAAAIGVFVWCAYESGFSLPNLIHGVPFIFEFLAGAFPPSLTNIEQYLLAMLETVQISIVGTVLAVFMAIPLGIGASSNFSPHPMIYRICRFLLNLTRSVPEMIVALVFVSAVGLGPFPGVLALAIHSASMLGKFYSESIENVNRGTVEALEASGANRLQILRFAVLPQILPEFITVNLYRWEINVRAATILGLVGAGGIGFEVVNSMKLFQYQNTLTIIILILITVSAIDKLNNKIRSKVL